MGLCTDNSMNIILNNAFGLRQIIIGEIRSHPGLGHHRGRKLDYTVDLGIIYPHLTTFLEGAVAFILCRSNDCKKAVFFPFGPGLDSNNSFPIRAMNGHIHSGD